MHYDPARAVNVSSRLLLSMESRLRVLLEESTGQPPELPVVQIGEWHSFLSHSWATGQDQATN